MSDTPYLDTHAQLVVAEHRIIELESDNARLRASLEIAEKYCATVLADFESVLAGIDGIVQQHSARRKEA